jgi:hypothetical protein
MLRRLRFNRGVVHIVAVGSIILCFSSFFPYIFVVVQFYL